MLWSNGLSSAVSSDAVGPSLLDPWANHTLADRTITVGHSGSAIGDGIQCAARAREGLPTVHGRVRPVSPSRKILRE